LNYWTVDSNEVGKHNLHTGPSVFAAVRDEKHPVPLHAEDVSLKRPVSTTSFTMNDERLSAWSQSAAKRIFDCGCVLISLPVLLPVLLVVGTAVRLTSRGPVLFIQRRVGRFGKTFPILKFRTMAHHNTQRAKNAVTTADNQRFTLVGPFLRRWKIDELPQLFNVLLGDMSLVGPRPKLPEHCDEMPRFACRPGITGAATVAFAREEKFLADVPKEMLNTYYHSVVLPAKLQLDIDYMAQATFASDFNLLLSSVLRRWDNSIWKTISYGNKTALRKDVKSSKEPVKSPEFVYQTIRPEPSNFAR
jgi:lipopolysaccharide/colanic/teichoic acid biosynthesis glycosyltransferase